jgi:formate dehydrogenase major subunit
MGSNMAENHPVGFQWVMEAKGRGARIMHIDPRFTRTSAMADTFVPLRPGTDIAFLGGLIHHILEGEHDFREYVLPYTNASHIIDEGVALPDDLDGLFSGYDPETGTYDDASWQYEGDAPDMHAAAGDRGNDLPEDEDDGEEGGQGGGGEAGAEAFEGGSIENVGHIERDETLQHPRCVYQLLKRHYASYTPAAVASICGISEQRFLTVADALVENSGRERTSAIVYSVGWTQHTTGAQNIRAAAIVQLLLGNIGRPGGGILALRGHASIQGSTDVPTLFDLLPGYLPMPTARKHADLTTYAKRTTAAKGFWSLTPTYLISLLKAWWGEHATPDNDFRYDHLPKITGDHSAYQTTLDMLDGKVHGYMLFGQNPVVGSANSRLHRMALAELDWLVVRDLAMIESATFWKQGPEIESGELVTEDIDTEVFFLPAAAHVEKDGTFTNTQRLLQWHQTAVTPKQDARSDLWFAFHLGRRIREKLDRSITYRTRDVPLHELTWDYPVEGPHDEPDASAVLREINGWDADGRPLSGFSELKDDGSTACGCWIYCGSYADGVNQTFRRTAWTEMGPAAQEWGWAWPMDRRMLYNRASADPDGKPWSERKAYIWWDEDVGRWTGLDTPDFAPDKHPHHRPDADATGVAALAGDDPFLMQADGKGWLWAPTGLLDGPLPSHYEPHESPVENPLHGSAQANPFRQIRPHRYNPDNPSAPDPDAATYPYAATSYRIAEHHTAGGMSRFQSRLSELAKEMFVEVHPEVAAERQLTHGGWATIISSRTAIEARVMVTERMSPLVVGGLRRHQVGLPYHWGHGGIAPGDPANDLFSVVLDPNVHIQEVKAATCDILPGRRPRDHRLRELVETHRRDPDMVRAMRRSEAISGPGDPPSRAHDLLAGDARDREIDPTPDRPSKARSR